MVISHQYTDFFNNISSKAHDWVQNLCLNQLFHWHQSQIKKNTRICLVFLPVGDNGQFDIPLAFCQRIASVFHVALIMLLVLLACWGVFGHISSPRRPLPVKTIQTITFQVYLHKLRAANVKFLMPVQQQYSPHRK